MFVVGWAKIQLYVESLSFKQLFRSFFVWFWFFIFVYLLLFGEMTFVVILVWDSLAQYKNNILAYTIETKEDHRIPKLII